MFPLESGGEENKIFFGINQEASYPDSINHYSPDKLFPEYPFKEESLSKENHVYKLIREGFVALGYDSNNYGKACWNPLGSFINPGDRVLIKPNWVMHYNKNKTHKGNMDCLITHPSVVRAIIDYVHIALNNNGEIIVADAPMQGCNLEKLLAITGYLDLLKFYKNKEIKIEFADLRERRVVSHKGLITKIIPVNSEDEAVIVNLGNQSCHSHGDEAGYKVSDYSIDSTGSYHCRGKHAYSISKKVLQSDCIINIPKPKTHRLAGITAAQKNIVGIIHDKASLPHRKTGSPEEGGDEYKKKSITKHCIANLEEKKLKKSEKGNIFAAIICQVFILPLYFLVKLFFNEKTMIGSWPGNDTIWRTVTDLNLIVKYADDIGVISDAPKRNILNVSDMIIAGQGNGPIGPDPKSLGVILIGKDASYIDALCCKIMGFDINKIPGLIESMKNLKSGYSGTKKIYSNLPEYNKLLYEDFIPEPDWYFKPHDSWKDHLGKILF